MKTCLKCSCGRRIVRKDVMRQRFYERQLGPSYVYIRYRCSHCKRPGEHFVRQEEWSDELLNDVIAESSDLQQKQFAALGPITLTEMRSFHHALADLNSLPDPTKEN